MKILVLQDYLRSGGTERQSLELTAGFRKAGQEARLVTFRPGGVLKVPDDLPRIALQSRDLAWDWYAPGLRTLVRKEAPDIVLAMGRMANCHLSLLDAKHRIATFRTGKPLPYLFRRSLAKADHVVANSAEAAHTLTAKYQIPADRISVIYNGLLAKDPNGDRGVGGAGGAPPLGTPARDGRLARNSNGHNDRREAGGSALAPSLGPRFGTHSDATSRENPASPDRITEETVLSSSSRGPSSRARARILVCVAMFRPEKNQRELIEIVSKLPPEPAWELWLAGDGPARPECEALAKTLLVADRVKFLGLVRDPRSLYRQADIAVHASASEALSNFLIEAQAHGLPAVAYDAQGVSETFLPNQTGWVIPRGDQNAFRSALHRLMTLPPPGLAEEAASFAKQRFDPASQIESYLALFRRIVNVTQ